MPVARGRSDRVTLTCPVTVRWTDEEGRALELEGRTTSINRHGARIEAGQPLPAGQVIRLVNPLSKREADFRVVGLISTAAGSGGVYAVLGPLSAETSDGNEFGVACLETKVNFWGLHFPPLPAGDLAERRVTLECRTCHRSRALQISIVAVEVLESAGSLSWPCDQCGTITAWGYPERKASFGEGRPAAAIEAGVPSNGRRASQVPVLVRRASGEAEHTQSEDVSKGGFSFVSEIDYGIGDRVMVACPYNAQDSNAEVAAQIARKQEIRGTGRKVFGVRYG